MAQLVYRLVLTGHSRGIGAAIAEEALAREWPVLALARGSNEALAGRHGKRLKEVALDLADIERLGAWLAGGELSAFVAGDTPTMLINNAGLLQPIGPVGHQDPSGLAAAVAVNVTAPLLLSNAFVHATESSADRRLLHISSGAARQAYAGWSAYCAGKAALDRHAEAMQLEGHPGLRVASVAPGVVDTAMQGEIRASDDAAFPNREKFVALNNDGYLAAPQSVARKLLDYVVSESFGATALTDLRQL